MDIKKFVDSLITDAGGTPAVDLTKRTTIGGMDPNDPAHRKLKANGQQEDYVILSADERARGYVRPVRRTYRHIKCGQNTTMGTALAETYARKPDFYNGTFCVACAAHFDLVLRTDDAAIRQFTWIDDGTGVGT